MHSFLLLAAAAFFPAQTEPPAPNTWTKLDQAIVHGRRWDIPVGYDPAAGRFLILGGRSTYGDYRKPRSYDVLGLEEKTGCWENLFPPGKDWGPAFGPCQAPPWKSEVFGLKDAAGTTRPNWTVYGTFSLGRKYAYDSRRKSFLFYAGGHTFRYDPAARTWTDLQPADHPEGKLGGKLLWSSFCYSGHDDRFYLFGGGNVRTERGDPGTWTYTPKTNEWQQLTLDRQPPQRANSQLVYDPEHKKIVLFGGDRLNRLLADTWVFDIAAGRWEDRTPAVGPAPRAGHALLWLPKAKKVLLLGGYGYTSATGYVSSLYRRLPLEAWTYDVAANRWDLVARFGEKEVPAGPTNFFLGAAVDADDRLLVVADGTWTCKLDASRVDAAGTKKHGVPPGTTEQRTGPHDPDWFSRDVPPADPEKAAADLKDLPAGRWVMRPTPKLPRPNMDWGSAVFAPELDRILRFSGGHSAYSGTAPVVYDVKNDRYSLPFAPEYPIEYVYSNDQVDGEWSFGGNPWMTGHTYRSTGYDHRLRCLVFAPHDYTYFFDPIQGKWSRSPETNPYRSNFYTVTVRETPQGAVVWAQDRKGAVGLWRLDADSRTWRPLPLQGELPATSADQHGMVYDAKRDRLLFFSGVGKRKGNAAAYDFRTGKARWLDPEGWEKAAVPCRENVYLPEHDLVLIGARFPQGEEKRWLVYDAAANAYRTVHLPGDDPIGKGTFNGVFNNSMGLVYDPHRRLVWAVGQNSHVHVLRFDASAKRLPLEK